jgi:hypothetical protein
MKRHVTTLLCAGAFTVMSICGWYAILHLWEPQWLAYIAFAPALPAFLARWLFVGSAHEGIPPPPGLLVFTATFVLWAAVIHVIRWFRS